MWGLRRDSRGGRRWGKNWRRLGGRGTTIWLWRWLWLFGGERGRRSKGPGAAPQPGVAGTKEAVRRPGPLPYGRGSVWEPVEPEWAFRLGGVFACARFEPFGAAEENFHARIGVGMRVLREMQFRHAAQVQPRSQFM